MDLNKVIIGFAQSDINYGLTKKKNFGKIINKLYKLGISSIDTAPTYLNSASYISQIKDINKFKVCSKLPSVNCRFDKIKDEVNNCVRTILIANSIKKIDTILIHDPLLPLDSKRWNIVNNCLQKFKKKKIIKKIGISVYTVNELQNVMKVFKPDVVQFPLNIFNQEFFNYNLLKSLKKKKIQLIARSIFLQGLLCKKNINKKSFHYIWKDKLNYWFQYLKKNKKTPEELCLAFVNSVKYIDNLLLGVDDLSQLKKNLKILKSNTKIKNLRDLKDFYDHDDILNDPRYWNKIKNKNQISDWIISNKFILNGGMLLSKKPHQFLPGLWPTFYKKAKNCFIWDKYNRKFLDFSLMGVGTNILGYSNNFINQKLKKVIDNSNITTLNSEYNLELSKKLLSMHSWASKSLFARTGAEANAIALRIARSFTQKDEVAICGYHGWHDWYLSANLNNNKNLDKILLPGLSTIGIPNRLKGLTHPFKYNDFDSLKKIIRKNKNIGTIFMEVQRNEKPKNNFLKKIRKLADKNGKILIFDECTSGFRETFGGLHKKYKINPDIAVFGKAIGNGIPLTAVIGRNEVMSKANQSFISSTFWTDGLGPAAALKTLEIMEKNKSWLKITRTGRKIKKNWRKISKKYKLDIEISGLDSVPMFNFKSNKNQYYKAYISQEMLKKGFLTSNVVYCSTHHEKYLSVYFKELEIIFRKIKAIDQKGNIFSFLESPIGRSGFGRLN